MTARPKTAGEPEAAFLGRTWRAHLDDLHELFTEDRWLEVAERFSGMLSTRQ